MRIATVWVACLLLVGCVSNEKMIDAAAEGNTGVMLEALEGGADPNFRSRAPGRVGDTAMSAAARNGHRATVQALIRQKVKPREQPEAIIAAAETGRTGIVRDLLDAGASPNAVLPTATPGGEVRTPLGMAALGGHKKTVAALLSLKAEADANSSVALRHAIRGGHVDIAELLIAKGADAGLVGPDQRTLLHLAATLAKGERRGTNRSGFLKKLVEKGVKVDAPDAQGETALMLAVRSEAFRHVETLLELGADPNKKIEGVGTPLEWAEKNKASSPEMSKIARMLAAQKK